MAERMAINSPIQGTAADIIKLAMINIQDILHDRHLKSKMILQVHDELIFDVVPEELETMKVLVVEQMEGAVKLSVPLRVEMGIGDNWYDLK
jgi:DNA polymerase-1